MKDGYGWDNEQVIKALRELTPTWTVLEFAMRLMKIKEDTRTKVTIANASNDELTACYYNGYKHAMRDAGELLRFFVMSEEEKSKYLDALFDAHETFAEQRAKADRTQGEIRRRHREEYDAECEANPCRISHDGFLAKENCHIMWLD